MPFATLVAGLALMSTTGWARYVLDQDYMAGGNFFDQFTFWNTTDPTNGFVLYQTEDSARNMGLINSSASDIYMGVDHTSIASNGRASVRITSKASYNSGLFIIDLAHMPGGICGTWPAFWMVGPDWPNGGEIDIIEGINDNQSDDMTLHTGPGCTLGGGYTGDSSSVFSGSVVSTDCVSNSTSNQGCQITAENTATYGTEFNRNGGGVYATEWTDEHIAIYWFPRNNIPWDVLGSSPDPSGWGKPLALFSGSGCDYGTSFTNLQIVFDTTFCGDWAGNAWNGSTCAASTREATCNAFVANNPGAFDDAYWSVNSLKVYSNNGGSSPPPYSASAPQSSPTGWGGAPSGIPSGVPSGSPTGIPETSGTPGWPAPSGGAPSSPQSAAPSPPASAPPPPPSAAPPAPTGQPISEVSGRPQWGANPSQTWGGHNPWQSGHANVNENENSDGSWSAGTPAGSNDHVVSVVKVVTTTVDTTVYETVVARHLGRHRRRHGGRRL